MSNKSDSCPALPILPPRLSLLRHRAPILLFFASVALLFIGWGCWQEYTEYRLNQLVKELKNEGVKVSFYWQEPKWLREYERTISWSWRERLRECFSSRESSAELTGDKVRPETLAKLANIPWLSGLTLYHTSSITDDSLASLFQCKSLRMLGFSHVPIAGTGLANLSQLKQLDRIGFYECPINDEGLQCIRELSNLRSIYLQNPKLNSIQLVGMTAANANGSSNLKVGDKLTMKCTFKFALPRSKPISAYFQGNSKDGTQYVNFVGTANATGEGVFTVNGTCTTPLSISGKFKTYCVIIVPGPPDLQISLSTLEFEVSEP